MDVIAAAIENTYDREATLKDKRRDVVDAIDELTDTRAKLVRTRAQLKQKRPQLIAQRKTPGPAATSCDRSCTRRGAARRAGGAGTHPARTAATGGPTEGGHRHDDGDLSTSSMPASRN